MKSINVTQTTNKKVSMVVGLNTNLKVSAKVNTRENAVSNIEVDIECTDRSERDLIEALLKKKRFKQSDGMRTKKEFSLESRGNQGKWKEHVVLHGPSAEKMLKHICETFEVKLPESNFYLD